MIVDARGRGVVPPEPAHVGLVRLAILLVPIAFLLWALWSAGGYVAVAVGLLAIALAVASGR